MTFTIAFARPDFSLIASDTRSTARAHPDGPALGYEDGGAKIYAFGDGWLASGPSVEFRERILAGMRPCEALAAIEEQGAAWAAAVRERQGTLRIGPGTSECLSWNGLPKFPDDGPHLVQSLCPNGSEPAVMQRFLDAYQAAIRGRSLADVLVETRRLFARAFAHCGVHGTVSPSFYVGIVWPDARRELLGPFQASVLLDDGQFSLRATQSDGSTQTSDALNLQGSLLPFVSPSSFFSYADGGPATGQMWISFGWSAGSFNLPDGTTRAIAAAPAAPSAPTLGQVAGGALGARTRWVRIAYAHADSVATNLYPVSAESSFAISANNLLKVTSPADPGGGLYDGYVVLVGSATNTEFVQGVAHGEVIPFGTDWTEPTAGFSTTQNSAWSASWKSLTRVALATATTYYHYPYYDIAKAIVRMRSSSGVRSPALAAEQNGDGKLSLGSYDATVGYSGAAAIATPGAGGSNSGTIGGGRLQ